MCRKKFTICCFNYYWLITGSSYLSRSLTCNLFPYSCFLLNSTECVYMFSYWCINLTPKATIVRSGGLYVVMASLRQSVMGGISDCPSWIYVVVKCSKEQLCGDVAESGDWQLITSHPQLRAGREEDTRMLVYFLASAQLCSPLLHNPGMPVSSATHSELDLLTSMTLIKEASPDRSIGQPSVESPSSRLPTRWI